MWNDRCSFSRIEFIYIGTTSLAEGGSLTNVKKTLFYVAAAIGVLAIIAGIYFLIPGIYHPYLSLHEGNLYFVDGTKHPLVVKSVHRFYAVGSFVWAAIFIVIAFFTRPNRVHSQKA
jgi:hypothetical protein